METCRLCRFYVADPNLGGTASGVCRRYPPAAVRGEDNSWMSSHPVVRSDGFCGEFKVQPS